MAHNINFTAQNSAEFDLRTCCIEELSNYKITWISSAVIFVGFIVNMLTLTVANDDKVSYFKELFP